MQHRAVQGRVYRVPRSSFKRSGDGSAEILNCRYSTTPALLQWKQDVDEELRPREVRAEINGDPQSTRTLPPEHSLLASERGNGLVFWSGVTNRYCCSGLQRGWKH